MSRERVVVVIAAFMAAMTVIAARGLRSNTGPLGRAQSVVTSTLLPTSTGTVVTGAGFVRFDTSETPYPVVTLDVTPTHNPVFATLTP